MGALSQVGWFVANGYTSLPTSADSLGKKVGWFADVATGRTLSMSNLFRQGVATYLHCTGIDGGYAFFSPGVPNSYKVVFEIRYPDGTVEYELPNVSRTATSVRLFTILNNIGRANNDALREVMLKMLTYPIAQEHPTANTVRTIFGYIQEPTIAEARNGKKESYQVLYAYDFALPPSPVRKQSP